MDGETLGSTAAKLRMVFAEGISGTAWAIAHINALSSRTMATPWGYEKESHTATWN